MRSQMLLVAIIATSTTVYGQDASEPASRRSEPPMLN